ncbi:MAG: hypothetical protein Tsb0034_05350 [Ekhidna sp.]
MNKTELITFLRDPGKLTTKDLEELEELVNENPYFLSARLLLAKGSKELKDPKTKKRIASAAIYSTDRVLLKKYLSGDLFFLHKPPPEDSIKKPKGAPSEREKKEAQKASIKKVTTTTDSQPKEETPPKPRADIRPSALKKEENKPTPKVPEVPSGHLDSILEELEKDMKDLKASREHFAEVQQKIEEEDAVSSVIKKAAVPDKEKAEYPGEQSNENIPSIEVSKEQEQPKVDEAPAPAEAKEDENNEIDAVQPAEKAPKKDAGNVNEDEVIEKKLAELSSRKSDDKIGKDGDSKERAERIIREPRFSRFSTRSYLKDLRNQESEPPSDDEESLEAKAEKKKTAKQQEESIAPPEENAKSEEVKLSEETKPKEAKETKAKAPKKAASKAKSTTKKTSTKKDTSKKTTGKKKTSSKASTTKSKDTKKKDEKKDDGERERKSQLIDKFINEAPSIKYKRSQDLSPQDLAEESSTWDQNLASEYLAEIYLHQGNKARAIEIYKALSLKYPEKKSYFADLISKIE